MPNFNLYFILSLHLFFLPAAEANSLDSIVGELAKFDSKAEIQKCKKIDSELKELGVVPSKEFYLKREEAEYRKLIKKKPQKWIDFFNRHNFTSEKFKKIHNLTEDPENLKLLYAASDSHKKFRDLPHCTFRLYVPFRRSIEAFKTMSLNIKNSFSKTIQNSLSAELTSTVPVITTMVTMTLLRKMGETKWFANEKLVHLEKIKNEAKKKTQELNKKLDPVQIKSDKKSNREFIRIYLEEEIPLSKKIQGQILEVFPCLKNASCNWT